ncbi:MAG: DotU family type IV/VI secretion system protein [Myxococcales bacterium]|nr:DotU family type IV/VI secretion system protein [Myxococcales bacterium]
MAKNPSEADHFTYVKVWHCLSTVMQQVDALAAGIATASPEVLLDLRKQIRTALGQLAKVLSAELGAGEAQEVLLPPVLTCDELVLRRLPKNLRQNWPLLQAELYGLTDGGEKFFQLIDEKLLEVQPSPLLLEVLLYCIGRGFLGRFVTEPAKVLTYKDRLKERLRLHPRQERLASQYRQAERKALGVREPIDADGHRPLIAPLLLYVATFVVIVAIPFALVVLSNIPFSQAVSTTTAPPSEPTPSSPSSSDSPEDR